MDPLGATAPALRYWHYLALTWDPWPDLLHRPISADPNHLGSISRREVGQVHRLLRRAMVKAELRHQAPGPRHPAPRTPRAKSCVPMA